MVPEIVMDGLEVPLVLARLHVHRDHRVAEQVRALPVSAIGTRDRRRQRQIEQPAPLVEREVEGPRVGAEAPFPAVAIPRVMTDVARLRDGVELPQLRAVTRIEGARVADPADGPRRRIGADHDDVLVDERHRVIRHADIHGAVRAEAQIALAGLGVDRDQAASGSEDDAWRKATVAGPVRDTAAGERAAGNELLPDLLTRLGVERHDTIRGRQIHDAVDDNRRRLGIHTGGTAPPASRCRRTGLQAVCPGFREARDVPGVDLGQRRIRRAGVVVAVHRPVEGAAVGRRLSRGRRIGRRERPPSFRRPRLSAKATASYGLPLSA